MSSDTMVTTNRIEGTILEFIRDELAGGSPVDLDADANLLTSGLIDSVGIARLVAHVEDVVGVTVPPTDLVPSNFRTVGIMAAYLQGLAQR